MSAHAAEQVAVRTPLEALIYTLTLCASPAALMLLGSFSVFCSQPSVTFVQMTQHLGAGIVLSAVATELLPAMSAQAKTHWGSSALATLVGFFLGVAMMVSVEKFCGEPEEDEEEEQPPSPTKYHTHDKRRGSLNDSVSGSPVGQQRRRSLVENYRRSSLNEKDIDAADQPGQSHGRHHKDHDHHHGPGEHHHHHHRLPKESTSLLPVATTKAAAGPLSPVDLSKEVPWTLAVAVYVDSFMDGLLIGISAVAGQNAGLIMTVALTIEMMFLGLTFSASLRHLPSLQRYGLVTGAPLMILVGGTVGAYAAALLSANPIVQIGLIAFGVAALLYLVTEELLIEAHENGAGHVWYVDLMFFAGFIISVLLEQAVDSRSP